MSPRRGLWAKPAPAQIGPLREDAQDLPAWPFVVAYAAYFLWWVLGSGDLMWPLFAIIMVVFMIGRHGLRFPPGTIIWTFFLAWVLASMTMLDSGGRVIGAFYRFLLQLAPGIFAVYAYNARQTLSVRAIVGTMWGFLASTTIGGFIAMAAPTLRFKTLMYYLVPRALHSNDFVKEFTKRATTQWNPSSWILSDPRPSAPFIYSNTYGNVYSLIFPLALVFAYVLWRERSKWRFLVAAVCALSVIPAAATLNRGMYIGLIVVVVWVGFQRLRAGAWRTVLGIVAAVAVGIVAWLATPASQSLLERVAASSSTEDPPRTTWRRCTSSSSPRSSGSVRRVPRRRRGCPPWARRASSGLSSSPTAWSAWRCSSPSSCACSRGSGVPRTCTARSWAASSWRPWWNSSTTA